MTLTGYGGVGEIGGNAFLVDDGRSRIFLDFGKRFGSTSSKTEQLASRPAGWGDYYDLMMKPRAGQQVHDLLALGLLPPLPGIYRTDLGSTPKLTDASSRPLDMVLVSHPHADHYGMMGYLKPETQFAMSTLSKMTLESVQKTGGGKGPDESFVRYKSPLAPDVRVNKDRPAAEVLATMPERNIQTGNRTEAGDWAITRYDVDHSIHGASAFILEHQKGGPTIAYSGDLRLHGRHPEATKKFLEAAKGADVLMVEGTRVGHGHGSHDRDGPLTEHDVEAEIAEALGSPELQRGVGFAAIAYPPRDLDRLESILKAATRAGRRLVITPRQAHLLRLLHDKGHVTELADPLANGNLRILVDADDLRTARAANGPANGQAASGGDAQAKDRGGAWGVWTRDVKDLDERIFASDRAVTTQDVHANPREYLFTMSSFTLNLLPGLIEPDKSGSGVFIHSQTQPFNDEGVLRDFRLNRWLQKFGLKEFDTHVSGHITQEALFAALDDLGHKRLVPIHTENAGETAKHYSAGNRGSVLVPVAGQPITLG